MPRKLEMPKDVSKVLAEARKKVDSPDPRPQLRRANPKAVNVAEEAAQLRAIRESGGNGSADEMLGSRMNPLVLAAGGTSPVAVAATTTPAVLKARKDLKEMGVKVLDDPDALLNLAMLGMFAGRIKATNGGVLNNDAHLYHGGLPLNGKIRTSPGSKVPVSESGVVGFRAAKDYYDAYRNVRGGLMYDVVIPKGTRVARISEGSLDTLTAEQASTLASKGFPVAVGIDNTGKTTVAVLDTDALAKYMSVRKDDLYRASLMNSIARDARGEYVASHGTTAKNALTMLSGNGVRNLSSAIVPAGELSVAGNGFGINARSGTGVRFFLKNDAVVPSVEKRQVVYKGDAYTLTESQLKRKVQALRKQNPGMSEESAVESVLKSTHEDIVRDYNRADRANAEDLARSILSKDNPTEKEIAKYLGENAEYGDILINGDSIPRHFLDTGDHNILRDLHRQAENTTAGTGGYAEGKMYRTVPASEVFGGAIVENRGGAESTALRKALDKAGIPHSIYSDDVSELAEQVRIAPRLDVRQAAKGGDASGESKASSTPQASEASEASEASAESYSGPRIAVNPEVFSDDRDALCVALNEAFRIIMEINGFDPVAEPTDAQRRFFADTAYANDETMLRRTILARICTFDTSIGKPAGGEHTGHTESTEPTQEQLEEAVEFLHTVLEIGAPQNKWEQNVVKRILTVLEKAVEVGRSSPAEEAPAEEAPAEEAPAEEAPVSSPEEVQGDFYGGAVSKEEEDEFKRLDAEADRQIAEEKEVKQFLKERGMEYGPGTTTMEDAVAKHTEMVSGGSVGSASAGSSAVTGFGSAEDIAKQRSELEKWAADRDAKLEKDAESELGAKVFAGTATDEEKAQWNGVAQQAGGDAVVQQDPSSRFVTNKAGMTVLNRDGSGAASRQAADFRGSTFDRATGNWSFADGTRMTSADRKAMNDIFNRGGRFDSSSIRKGMDEFDWS